jgi:hypothetical protein
MTLEMKETNWQNMKRNIRLLFMYTIPIGIIVIFWYIIYLFISTTPSEELFNNLEAFLVGGCIIYFLTNLYSTK